MNTCINCLCNIDHLHPHAACCNECADMMDEWSYIIEQAEAMEPEPEYIGLIANAKSGAMAHQQAPNKPPKFQQWIPEPSYSGTAIPF